MTPLSEHERKVLKELERSLFGDAGDPLHSTAQEEYKRRRRGAISGAVASLVGAVVMTIFLTQILAVSLAGLFTMIAGSLVFANNFLLARRASQMSKLPPPAPGTY
jgi:hypothetical protein